MSITPAAVAPLHRPAAVQDFADAFTQALSGLDLFDIGSKAGFHPVFLEMITDGDWVPAPEVLKEIAVAMDADLEALERLARPARAAERGC